MVVVAVGGWTSLQQGWLSAERLGFQIPESMQPKPEVTLALLTVESGRAADATVVPAATVPTARMAERAVREARSRRRVLAGGAARIATRVLMVVANAGESRQD